MSCVRCPCRPWLAVSRICRNSAHGNRLAKEVESPVWRGFRHGGSTAFVDLSSSISSRRNGVTVTSVPIPTNPSVRTVWAVTTGEAGKVSQAEGLAEALGWPFESIVVRLRRPWSWSPAHRQPPGLLRCGVEKSLPQLWPDLLISCGRRSVPVAAAVRRAAGGRTFAVHIQNPRTPLRCFDLIVPLEHDGLAGPNVVATRAALHRITPEKLASAGARNGRNGSAILTSRCCSAAARAHTASRGRRSMSWRAASRLSTRKSR